MNLDALNSSQSLDTALAQGPCVVVKVEAINNGVMTVGMLTKNPLAKVGTFLPLRGDGNGKGVTVDAIVNGRVGETASKSIPPIAIGDVLIFEHAIIHEGGLYAGRVAARMHDGLAGKVQCSIFQARVMQAKVGKKNAAQTIQLVNPAAAFRSADVDEFKDLATKALTLGSPGGQFGLHLHDGKQFLTFMSDYDGKAHEKVEDFLHRLLVVNEVLGQGALEAFPIWQLPAGRDQIRRDINPAVETNGWVEGPFSSQFVAGSFRGFMQSVVITADEDQWEFGGKTGRKHRVVAGIQPMPKASKVHLNNIGTKFRPNQSTGLLGKIDLFKVDQMETGAKGRDERRKLWDAQFEIEHTNNRTSTIDFNKLSRPKQPRDDHSYGEDSDLSYSGDISQFGL